MANRTDWALVESQLAALLEGTDVWVSVLANASAHLMESLDDLNWVGFYLTGRVLGQRVGEDELALGPFQGRVACERIASGRGVCGNALARDETIRVDDVHKFAGHIACDSASRAEIVVPLHVGGHVVGVLDVDSPHLERFDAADQAGLEACVRIIERFLPQDHDPAVGLWSVLTTNPQRDRGQN